MILLRVFVQLVLHHSHRIVNKLDYPFGKGREAFVMENHTRGSIHSGFVDTLRSGASTHSEMIHFEIRRTPDFDVTLSHVTDFPNARLALWFRFFIIFEKSSKSRSKRGDRMMPASMANRFKERSLLEQLQNHAPNYRGALGLSRPSDPPRKK